MYIKTVVEKITNEGVIIKITQDISDISKHNPYLELNIDIRISNKSKDGYKRMMSLGYGNTIHITNDSILYVGMSDKLKNKEISKNDSAWYFEIRDDNTCVVSNNTDDTIVITQDEELYLALTSEKAKHALFVKL